MGRGSASAGAVTGGFLVLVALGSCETVETKGDGTPPSIRLEVLGVKQSSAPGAADDVVFVSGQGVSVRRSVPALAPLTFAASAEDRDSGVALLEIGTRPWVVCRWNPPGSVPLRESWRLAGITRVASGAYSGVPSGIPQPLQRNATFAARIADLVPQQCPVRTFQSSAGPVQITGVVESFCDLAVYARATNGDGSSGSSPDIGLVPGPIGSPPATCP